MYSNLNPQLTYKLTGRFNLGIGWNECIAYSTKTDQFVKAEHIYGPRSYVHFKFKSGFSLKGDIETMRTNVPVLSSQDQLTRDWVWSYFGGIKKDFQFTKGVIGNVQLMYNLVDHDHRSSYANRFNVRIGFEFQTKNKTKK